MNDAESTGRITSPTKTDLRRGRIQRTTAVDSRALISEDEQDFLFTKEPPQEEKSMPKM